MSFGGAGALEEQLPAEEAPASGGGGAEKERQCWGRAEPGRACEGLAQGPGGRGAARRRRSVRAQANLINLTRLFGLVKKSRDNEAKCRTQPSLANGPKKFLVKAGAETQAQQALRRAALLGRKPERRGERIWHPPKTKTPRGKQAMALEKSGSTRLEARRRGSRRLAKSRTAPEKGARPGEAPLALFRSGDAHVKRFLRGMGVEVRAKGGRAVREEGLRWVAQDAKADHRRLRGAALFNHFENIDELTRKASLSSNLEAGGAPFYPLTFAPSVKADRRSFKEAFLLRVSFQLLKNHVAYFRAKRPGLAPRLQAFLRRKWERRFAEKEAAPPGPDSLFFENCLSKFVSLSSDDPSPDFVVNTLLLGQMLYLWRSLARRLFSVEDEFHFFSPLKFDAEAWSRFQRYAELPLAYEALDAAQRVSVGLAEEYWATPSSSLLVILLDLDALFRLKLPAYVEESARNLWIVKPSCNSKGTGIFVSRRLAEIRGAWEKNQNRIIQKYVEDCPTLGGKKFDLRLWVLLESVRPLRVWLFEDFYARLCFDDFDLARLEPTRHLTNFSLNKRKFAGNAQASVLDKRGLLAQLKE